MIAVLALLALLDDPPVLRETVVVTAERAEQKLEETTAAVTVIRREEIARMPAQCLAEVLPLVAGIDLMFPRPGGSVPMLATRGFFGGGEVEYVQLLVDSVPIADPESGIADLHGISAGSIERIEVLRGPGSSLYGDTALGGVIHVITRGAKPGRRARVVAGSSQFASADVHVTDERLTVSGTAWTTSGDRDHSGARDISLDASVALAPWTFALGGSHRDRQEPGPLTRFEDRGSSNALFDDDDEAITRFRGSARFDGLQHELLVYANHRESEQTRTLLLVAGLGDTAFRTIDTTTFGAALSGRTASLRWGIDAARDTVDTSYGPATADAARNKLAGYATYESPQLGRFRFTGGARYDVIDDTDKRHTAFSPRAGVNFIQGSTSAFAQISRAFKAPTLAQLYDPRPFPDFAGGTFTISNPTLSPQRALNMEAGIARRGERGELEAVLYRMRVDDEIDFDPATFRYGNIGATTHEGLELTARARPVFATYALTRVFPKNGGQLKNIPLHMLRAGVTIPAPVDATLLARWTSRRWLDDAHTESLPSALVFDARLSRALGKYTLLVDLLNLTNRRYSQVGYLLPNFTGGMERYEFPADGFGLRLGVELDF